MDAEEQESIAKIIKSKTNLPPRTPNLGTRTQLSDIERHYLSYLHDGETVLPSPINLDTTMAQTHTEKNRRGIHAPPPGYIERSHQFLWDKQENYAPPESPLRSFSFEQISRKRDTLPCASPGIDDLCFNKFTCGYSQKPNFSNSLSRIPEKCSSLDVRHSPGKLRKNIAGCYTLFSKRYIVISSVITFVAAIMFVKAERMMQVSGVRGVDSVKTRMTRIRNQIVAISFDASLDVKNSPQHSALQWITNDDPMQLDPVDEKLMIRYSLAVFFFALNGMVWNHTDAWMSGSNVCYWHGITCRTDSSLTLTGGDNETTRITSFNMSDTNLSGPLVREVFLTLKVSSNPQYNLE